MQNRPGFIIPFKLEGKRIILRPLRLSDVPAIVRICNDREVMKYLGGEFKYPTNAAEERKFIRRTWKKRDGVEPGIALKETGEIIGGVVLKGLGDENAYKVGEIGYWLGRKYWNRGYAVEAVSLMLDYAFRQLKLRKVFARVYQPNILSVKLLKKLGFKKEAVLKEHVKSRFTRDWFDVEYYSTVNEKINRKLSLFKYGSD